MKTCLLLPGLLVWALPNALAQPQQTDDPYAHKWTVAAGLTQPLLLGGVNLAGTYFTRRWTFEYSHGMNLTMTGRLLTDRHVESVYARYSTGLGVGYRLTRLLDVRAEAKVHEFSVQLTTQRRITYTNVDLGAGAYYRIYPFRRQPSWVRGLLLEPSVRYWAPIASTLPRSETIYVDASGTLRQHKPYSFNFFANVSVAYTFGLR